jgi:hypothetical protein
VSASFPDRRFQLWEYRVSHGALLIRSPKGPSAETNVDLVFSGVEYIGCPRMLRGVELVPAAAADIERVREEFGAVAHPNQVFVLLSDGARHVVVAASCHVSENLDDLFENMLI